ncbi:type II secretion system F family protein [Nocardioides caeni]|uniref:Type II secretion system protein n=1 Tax=Nocardioides caeni TaxID=574700 RepID=A0A4S8N0D4_9ACTN|nr:type II secretion system F family protein [Nocardioides caeni]THV09105.1 type II secretion system protein [Nocardioides caeni]
MTLVLTLGVAALAAGLAVAVLVVPMGRIDPPAGEESTLRALPGRRLVLLTAVPAAVAGAWWSSRTTMLVVLGIAVVVGAARLARGRREAREAGDRRARVVELCAGLQAELSAGLTPAAALGRAAEEWPLVAGVARVAEAGGDVPTALRALARTPGAESLCFVAAAWQVAHRTGHGLATALARVADDLRSAERTRRVVVGELASARATARLLAVLPALALAMGSGAGADPLGFLVGQPAGIACLAGGLLLTGLGLAWIDALARGVEASS